MALSITFVAPDSWRRLLPPAIDERLVRMKARSVDAARSTYWYIRGHKEPRLGQGRTVPAGSVHFLIHMKLRKYLFIRCRSF